MIWEIVGGLGVVFTSAQLLPQMVKSLRTRQVRDISLGMCIIVGLSAISWLVYGLHLGDMPMVLANLINLCSAVILFLIKYNSKE
ncbi:MAG: SemiSWEET family sugar transporter [Sedimentisphaerales bacterium]